MSPLFTLLSSLPFIFVFSTLLLSSYFTTAPLLSPPPTNLLPLAELLPPTSTPRPDRHRTISAADLGPPRKLFPSPAQPVASTPVCISVEQAPNDDDDNDTAQSVKQPKATKKKKKKKKPKTVSFALENNTTRTVDRWIRKVRWARYDEVFDVDRWIEPHGRAQRSFPKTAFVRDGPDADAVDAEGDLEMLDCGR